jgi:excisionase family DNA binding protein
MSDQEAIRATVNVEEAAAILGIGRTHAYRLVRTGKFPVPVITIGERYVISRRLLDELLAGKLQIGTGNQQIPKN